MLEHIDLTGGVDGEVLVGDSDGGETQVVVVVRPQEVGGVGHAFSLLVTAGYLARQLLDRDILVLRVQPLELGLFVIGVASCS